MPEDTAILATRWFQEVWIARSDDAIDRMAAHDCISHQPDGTIVTLDEWRRFRAELFNGFPDFNLTVEGLALRFRACRIVEGWDGWDVGGLVWYLTRPSRDESPAHGMFRPVER